MWRAIKRRIRDREFVEFDRERLFARAFAAAATDLGSWDLFPPVEGYRPYNAKSSTSYLVSGQRQHSDWSAAVIKRDSRECQECGSTVGLEAHHIFPQSWYPSLRYVLKNGRTLCHPCHERVATPREILPNQFLELTIDENLVNMNVCSTNYWSYHMGAIEKGRLRAHGLTETGAELSSEEDQWFGEWSELNGLTARIREASISSPLARTQFQAQLRLHG